MNQIRECRHVPIRCIHGNDRVIALLSTGTAVVLTVVVCSRNRVRATASGQQRYRACRCQQCTQKFSSLHSFSPFPLYDHQIYIQFQNLTTFLQNNYIPPRPPRNRNRTKFQFTRSICHILMMPTNCFVLRTFTILPVIRISWDFHPTFMLMSGRISRSCIHL